MRIERIFVSPGHNFAGRHGRPPGEHPIRELASAECVAGKGLRGDRYFGHQEDYKGQITFFAMEVIDALRQEPGFGQALPEATRRNVFTRGVDLNALIGAEFEVQGVRFVGVEECRPCNWMNQALGPGAEEWLRGRGGLRARILGDGVLRLDSRP